MGHDRALWASADAGIALPVADEESFSGDGGPLSDVHAAGDQAAPGVFAFALVVFLAVMAQAAPEAAAVSLVLPDMPVDAFAADAGLSLRPEPAADLIGAPLFLRQFFLDLADEAGVSFCAARPMRRRVWRTLSPAPVCNDTLCGQYCV